MMTNTDQNLLHSTLVRASEDESFRQLALSNAEEAIRQVIDEEGYEDIDPKKAGARTVFVESETEADAVDSADMDAIVLPKLGEDVALSEADLEAVAGGATGDESLISTYSIGCNNTNEEV